MNLNLSTFYSQIIQPIAIQFNTTLKDYDFFTFCFAYTLIFLFGAYLFRKPKTGWVAQIHQLLTFKERIGSKLIYYVFRIPIVSIFIRNKLKRQEKKLVDQFAEGLRKKEDSRKSTGLPEKGMTEQNLKKRIEEWNSKQKGMTGTKKISGSIYVDDEQFSRQLAKFAKNYLYQNPLHLDTFKELLKMQSQVLQMTGNLLSSKQRVYGTITSGGTQSLLLAINAYKQFYKKQRPNIIIPVSAHVAIQKACFYFNVECRKARLNKDFQVDMKHVRKLIDSNTILLVGSAPNYPHGIIDPIVQLGQLAKQKNIGLHVDACLGGFIVAFAESLKIDIPFNFKVDGVTSISIDHHKYGLAPKGVSALFFKTKKLRQSQYFSYTNWCGGIYTTATICGSRSGVGGAGAWFAMVNITFDGYKQNARLIMETVVNVSEQLRKTPGIQVYGKPKIAVFAFKSTKVSIYDLNEYLKQKGWSCNPLQKPEGLHITVTLANYEKIAKQFVKDVRDGLEIVKKQPGKYKGQTSAIYGLTQKIPNTSLKQSMLKVSLDAYLQ